MADRIYREPQDPALPRLTVDERLEFNCSMGELRRFMTEDILKRLDLLEDFIRQRTAP
jgi:hypothetical protein